MKTLIRKIANLYVKIDNKLKVSAAEDKFTSNSDVENGIRVGDSSKIFNKAEKRAITIGRGVTFYGQIDCFRDGRIEIGKYTYVGSNTRIICSTLIKIGQGCWISDNILIFDGAHHPISPSRRLRDAQMFGDLGIFPDPYQQSTKHKTTLIGDMVWIGANSVITAGVTIGNGAIIGAGSVVTSDVGERKIYAGNPAKMIGEVNEQ